MSACCAEKKAITLGVISDTHGLLRPAVRRAFAGVDQIIHAGDIDSRDVLTALQKLALVVAVRGNMDRGTDLPVLPESETFQAGNVWIHVRHDLAPLDLDPSAASIAVVISGHTHKPRMKRKDGVLYLNPGSAGHQRNRHAPSVALLKIDGRSVDAELITVE